MTKYLPILTLLLITSALPAQAVFEAMRVTAEFISCPKERGNTKHHQCKEIIIQYDCDEGVVRIQTKGRNDALAYRLGKADLELRRVCDLLTEDKDARQAIPNF